MTTKAVSNVHSTEHIYSNAIEDQSNSTKSKKTLKPMLPQNAFHTLKLLKMLFKKKFMYTQY